MRFFSKSTFSPNFFSTPNLFLSFTQPPLSFPPQILTFDAQSEFTNGVDNFLQWSSQRFGQSLLCLVDFVDGQRKELVNVDLLDLDVFFLVQTTIDVVFKAVNQRVENDVGFVEATAQLVRFLCDLKMEGLGEVCLA